MKDNRMVVISTDCVCDLPLAYRKKYQIPIMYYYIQTEVARFQDTFEMTSDDLIEYIEKDGRRAYSSSSTVEEYYRFFMDLRAKTQKPIIHICMAQYVSSAYEIASKAAENVENVYVVDSGHLSGGMGIMVLAAAEMAERGAVCEVILAELNRLKKMVSSSFIVNSTECLMRNGKIDKGVAQLCDFFRIHPILKLKDSAMKPVGFRIGSRYSFARSYIRSTLRKKDKIDAGIVFLITAGCSYEFQEFLKEELSKCMDWQQIVVNEASATISCNCGSGAFGILFVQKP